MGDGSEAHNRGGGVAFMRIIVKFTSSDGKRRNTKPMEVADIQSAVEHLISLQVAGCDIEFTVVKDDSRSE